MCAMVEQLTETQRSVLYEFRSIVTDILPEENSQDDTFLLRWLIAREFNLDKATVMLKNYIKWKETNEIDKILEWCPPDEMRETCPFQIIGNDFNGRPVLLFPWGKWKPWIFTSKFLQIYQTYMDYMIQSVVACIKPPATQFVIIGDSDGFTYGHMRYIKALEANLHAVKEFEAHYPELMHSAIVVNTPKAFTVVFALIKPLMSERTKSKLSLFGYEKEKWKQFLGERIPQELLPNKYRIDANHDKDGILNGDE